MSSHSSAGSNTSSSKISPDLNSDDSTSKDIEFIKFHNGEDAYINKIRENKNKKKMKVKQKKARMDTHEYSHVDLSASHSSSFSNSNSLNNNNSSSSSSSSSSNNNNNNNHKSSSSIFSLSYNSNNSNSGMMNNSKSLNSSFASSTNNNNSTTSSLKNRSPHNNTNSVFSTENESPIPSNPSPTGKRKWPISSGGKKIGNNLKNSISKMLGPPKSFATSLPNFEKVFNKNGNPSIENLVSYNDEEFLKWKYSCNQTVALGSVGFQIFGRLWYEFTVRLPQENYIHVDDLPIKFLFCFVFFARDKLFSWATVYPMYYFSHFISLFTIFSFQFHIISVFVLGESMCKDESTLILLGQSTLCENFETKTEPITELVFLMLSWYIVTIIYGCRFWYHCFSVLLALLFYYKNIAPLMDSDNSQALSVLLFAHAIFSLIIARWTQTRDLCLFTLYLEVRDYAFNEENNRINLETMISYACHELRNPLHAMLGSVEFLVPTLNPEQLEKINPAIHAGNQIVFLVNDILDIQKIKSGKLSVKSTGVDIRMLVFSLCKEYSILNGDVTISYQVDETIPQVLLLDSLRIQQLIGNGITNAFKSISKNLEGDLVEGAEIELVVNKISVSDEKSENNEKEMIKFSLYDNGPGIRNDYTHGDVYDNLPNDVKDTEWLPSAGMGLTISRMLVQGLGGTIGLHNREEKQGVVFWFTIPCNVPPDSVSLSTELHTKNDVNFIFGDDYNDKPPENHLDSSEAKIDLSNVRIALIEDESLNIFVTSSMAAKLGCTIDCLSDEVFLENLLNKDGQMIRDYFNKYDIILLDIVLSKLNGMFISRAMKAAGVLTPRVVVSANISEQTDSYLQSGFVAGLRKPFSISHLEKCLREVLVLHGKDGLNSTSQFQLSNENHNDNNRTEHVIDIESPEEKQEIL